MKKLYLLLLLSCGVFSAFSQNKTSFGFVVKAGNFSFPYQHKEVTNYSLSTGTEYYRQSTGYLFAIGVRESFHIDAHFKVSGELLFRQASYSTNDGYSIDPKAVGGAIITANRGLRFNESNLSIPIKLHYSFLSNGRMAVAMGAGIAMNIGTVIHGSSRYQNSQKDQNAYSYSNISPPFFSNRDINPELTLMAGFYHRISANTTIGLEFSYERRSTERRYNLDRIDCGGPLIDCLGYSYLGSPSMRSLSIELSHDLSKL